MPFHNRTPRTGLLLVFLAVLVFAAPTFGAELQITTANDFTSNEREDDLYTFGLGVTLTAGQWDIVLREDAFTDRDSEIRFDETYVGARRPLGWFGPFRALGEVGAVHVGKGLLGQATQNSVHDFLGSDTVELSYIEDSEVHPVLGLHLERDLPALGPLSNALELDVSTAPGFKSHAVAAIKSAWEITRPLDVEIRLGGRYSKTDFALLKPWIEKTKAMANLDVGIYDHLVLTWSYNEYGTGNQHLRLGYRFKAKPQVKWVESR